VANVPAFRIVVNGLQIDAVLLGKLLLQRSESGSCSKSLLGPKAVLGTVGHLRGIGAVADPAVLRCRWKPVAAAAVPVREPNRMRSCSNSRDVCETCGERGRRPRVRGDSDQISLNNAGSETHEVDLARVSQRVAKTFRQKRWDEIRVIGAHALAASLNPTSFIPPLRKDSARLALEPPGPGRATGASETGYDCRYGQSNFYNCIDRFVESGFPAGAGARNRATGAGSAEVQATVTRSSSLSARASSSLYAKALPR